ncbi:MAG: mitochondrial fission ELM1 family protein [Rhodospirillales bacterium]|nr:mitochondrial fission ELM1 family protein [Rhodospirillales bacterium]MCW8969970.1 mitochondrial fission ELM1 family protein [Rhodospirillales bacterium]MCW9003264.1 mitochondrial fission ELM1 family protein [Rhodospirillales bacterium]
MVDFTSAGKTPLIWVLTDDRAGNVSQCMGVAEALNLPFDIKKLEYTAAAALPNFIMMASFGGLTESTRVNMTMPWPDIVIAAGRRTAPVARHIKKLNNGRTFLVQIMHPGNTGVDEFDLIAVPHHDSMPDAANILKITGAPHRITSARLEKEADRWKGAFDALPSPRIALLVGGATKRRSFTDDMARDLGQAATAMAKAAGGSLLVTTSRRTGEAADALIASLEPPFTAFRWGDEGDNPYFGYLALADAIVVTGDSVSMCSEACATRKPTYIYSPKRFAPHKHTLLHKELFERGYARPFEGKLDVWDHEPLNAATDVAAEIRKRAWLD